MSGRIHVNPNTGATGKCRAQTPEACQFYNEESQTPSPHFNTEAEARRYYEETMSNNNLLTPITKSKHSSVKNTSIPNGVNFFGQKVKNKKISEMFVIGGRAEKKLYSKFKEGLLNGAVKINDDHLRNMFAV